MPTNPADEPAAQAHALLERLFALLRDCRTVVPQLEPAPTDPEPVSSQAERRLYFALVGALEAGLVRTAEDALTVLRQASQPLGPIGGGVVGATGAGSVTRAIWQRHREIRDTAQGGLTTLGKGAS